MDTGSFGGTVNTFFVSGDFCDGAVRLQIYSGCTVCSWQDQVVRRPRNAGKYL